MYLIKTPFWLRALYPSCTWRIPNKEQVIYLSFDDGPHPIATPFVLAQLAKYNAKASFFCIGKNVAEFPAIFNQIIAEGHAVGNHTQNHLNGWHTKTEIYIQNIELAAEKIPSNLFRPPYGRITRDQIKQIRRNTSLPQQIIMWDVLSGDFDISIKGEQCTRNVIKYAKSGSIIVFHDSAKAWDRISVALPKILEYFSQKGYEFRAIV
jgi:peptidoglycan/xylan/chitin deacetylase (PgdA/CDA1 family)